jgi:hypothetical protein
MDKKTQKGADVGNGIIVGVIIGIFAIFASLFTTSSKEKDK